MMPCVCKKGSFYFKSCTRFYLVDFCSKSFIRLFIWVRISEVLEISDIRSFGSGLFLPAFYYWAFVEGDNLEPLLILSLDWLRLKSFSMLLYSDAVGLLRDGF